MKNFKQILFKSFIITSIFLFISCSGDDGNDNGIPSIYDTWEYVGYIESGEYFSDTDECVGEIITFNIDNTGVIQIEDCDFGDETANFTWENISGNKYSITAFGTTSTVFITFPSGNNMMHVTEELDPAYSEVYQRR